MVSNHTSGAGKNGTGLNEGRPRSRFIGAIDQGTTSTRFLIFDDGGTCVASHQIELKQTYPHPGWVNRNSEAMKIVRMNGVNDLAGGWNKTLVKLWSQ